MACSCWVLNLWFVANDLCLGRQWLPDLKLGPFIREKNRNEHFLSIWSCAKLTCKTSLIEGKSYIQNYYSRLIKKRLLSSFFEYLIVICTCLKTNKIWQWTKKTETPSRNEKLHNLSQLSWLFESWFFKIILLLIKFL